MTNRTYLAALALGTALSLPAMPAFAQSAPAADSGPSDIIVTARRVEERLQDVPISITVFNQQQLANRNILDATDLATRTPSLQANNNFGNDNTVFAIRGFTQDIGTQPSVGTYFGEVVTPRGASNGQPVGDGASAGDFFDLQNVQVLKGPQGTLFGRNTTGGAVLFVPQKPTGKFEGFIQGSVGDFGMKRGQFVFNAPIADTFRVRFGLDRMVRTGYLDNISGIGPSHFNNTNYWAARFSAVADLTPNLENYIIASWSQSKSNGALDKLSAADATEGEFGALSAAQLARQNATGNFYAIENPMAQAGLKTTQWQVIDTTTWQARDGLTVKNIASYAEIKQTGASPIFGVRWPVNVGGTIYNSNFQQSSAPPGLDIAHESTFSEEFRLAGNTSDNRFTWQTGAYLEVVTPLSTVGSQSPGFASCRNGSNAVADCTNAITSLLLPPIPGFSAATAPFFYGLIPALQPAFVGNVNFTEGETSFHNVGLYAQGTYKVTDKISLTGGFRYTWDRETINTFQQVQVLNLAPIYGSFTSSCTNVFGADAGCNTHYHTKSKAPTWLIDADYKPTDDILLYAKYSRGYRAATIAPNIPEGRLASGALDSSLNYVKPEKVDTYEIGAKTSFRGAVHGTFNVAGFYNNFSNQQLQVGFLPISAGFPQTAAPVNAGKSKIYGAEVEATLSPVHGLNFDLGYTFLKTRIDKVLALPNNFAYNTQASFQVGDPEILSPKHKLSASAMYTLPLDPSVGRLSFGGTVTYRSSMLSNYIDFANPSRANPNPVFAALATLPALTLVDGNVNWNNVAGKPIDLGFFVTNLTNRHYYNFSAGLGAPSLGFEVSSVGAPRMYGFTAKWRFGR